MTVSTHDLTKTYGAFTLDVPDLRIPQGQVVGLVGNNGAGKTTLLRLVLDLIRADDGHVTVAGTPVAGAFDWKTRTGSYLDEGFLIDFFTPDEQLAFVASTYGLDAEALAERAAAFDAFYTDEPLGETTKYVRDLSQGNRKKVGLVAALLPTPDLVILDEPFSNLDPRSQMWLKGHLRSLHDARQPTMLISSHDLGHVTDVCERIVLLDAGRIARDEPVTDATLADLEHHFAAT
jgi:ABC-2 type transport system ATP-binding protein